MRIDCMRNGGSVTAALYGELDHHTAEKVRNALDAELLDGLDTFELIIDMSGVTFMDSSGLGVILGRYKLLNERGGVMRIINAAGHAEYIMRMSGVYSIIEEENTDEGGGIYV